MTDYEYEVVLKFVGTQEDADSEEHAKENIMLWFAEEYQLDVDESEITLKEV